MGQEIRGKYRDRPLTAEEAARYARLRRLAEEEFGAPDVTVPAAGGALTEELRSAIRNCGRSHFDLGRESNVSPKMIERFAAGERDIPLNIADRLAAALGLHLSSRAA